MKCAIERRKKIEGTHIQHILRVESVYVKPTSTKKKFAEIVKCVNTFFLNLIIVCIFQCYLPLCLSKTKRVESVSR